MSGWRKRQSGDYRVVGYSMNGVPLKEVMTRFAREIEQDLQMETEWRAAVVEEAMGITGLDMANAVLQKYRLTQNE